MPCGASLCKSAAWHEAAALDGWSKHLIHSDVTPDLRSTFFSASGHTVIRVPLRFRVSVTTLCVDPGFAIQVRPAGGVWTLGRVPSSSASMQSAGMSVGLCSPSPRTLQAPHTCRPSVVLRNGFLGTPASCLQHKALCGVRIESTLLTPGSSGTRRTTVMAAKGKPLLCVRSQNARCVMTKALRTRRRVFV